MSSITAQLTKLHLELVPKENRLDIEKCNGRIPSGLTPREPTFQVVLDAIALTPCYPTFLITADVPERTFAALINRGLSGKTSGLDKLRLSRAQILWESTQMYEAILPKCLTSSVMKESKAYKTYLGYATGDVPPKMAQKFKKASPSKKDIRKKSLKDFHKTHPSGSGTIAEKPQSVDKITPTVTSDGTGDKPGVLDVTEDDSTESEYESWGNDEDDSNNEQESSNEGSEQENESDEQESDSEQEEESKDDDPKEEDFVHTPTDDKDEDNLESESGDVVKRNENLETSQEQVVEDAHVTIYTVTKKTEVCVTSSSRSSDLASKFLNFLDIPHADAEILSPLDVHVHHEVPRTQAPTLLTISVFVITESSPVYTNIPQSSQTFTPPPILTTPNPPLIIVTTNPLSTLPDFASVFRFNDRVTTLEKEVAKLKKDLLDTQVTTLVDEHLDTQLGETGEEFMKFLSESLTTRIKEQLKDQPPQILPKEVSNFAPPVIEKLIKESRDEVTLAKVSSQPHSTYEAASTLTEFELKKILIDKIEKNFFFSYDVYSLKRGRKDKDKDEDPSAGSDRGLKKRKTSKDAEPTTEEPVFEVAASDMPQDQEGNLSDNDDEPRKEDAFRRDWFKKPTPPQDPNDPDWHEEKTP
ncbi:hypothetical protein Tco_1303365 [Tanacetum coccineum]